jgi:AraC-like DNA-binding protein
MEFDESMTVHTSISSDAGGYQAALSRARVDVTRTGAGCGPNALLDVSLEGLEVLSGYVQFPVIGRTTIADDAIAVILIVRAPPGTRWCEIDVAPGDLLMYGPGAGHIACSPTGVEYRVALINHHELDETSDALQVPTFRPARGSAARLNRTTAAQAVGRHLHAVGSPLRPSRELPTTSEGLLRCTARMLSELPEQKRRLSPRIESRHVVNECIRYADAIGRRPSISELCLASHVSERRLRSAFHDTFDMAPNAFFRKRLITRARDQLLGGAQTVTEVAFDLGFEHVGRFAGQYSTVHGEYPHDTLGHARTTEPSPAPNT